MVCSLQNLEIDAEDASAPQAQGIDMADYIQRDYTAGEVRAAGKALIKDLAYTEEAVHFFRVAHNFRMAHAYPLMRERIRLARLAGVDAFTSGRVKRMATIRKKLRRSGIHLDKLQDLAGIRAVAPDIASVQRIVARYRTDFGDQIKTPTDYIAAPKDTGYRSVHIVKTYAGSGEAWHGLKVEIQVRTQLQHVWATAQETVGMLTGNDLKGGEGDTRWMRLMVLMSSYIADLEGQPQATNAPSDPTSRKEEIVTLCDDLGAISFLSGFAALTEGLIQQRLNAGFYLLSLDAGKREVKVKHVSPFANGAEAYFHAADRGETVQSLLVSVDSAKALLQAYPTYFLDMTDFLGLLRAAIDPSAPAISSPSPSPPPSPPVQRAEIDTMDLSFLKDGAWRGRRG
jgi:ppGpp synthetase/RelA/SpoT-type nucleotidyltranferase